MNARTITMGLMLLSIGAVVNVAAAQPVRESPGAPDPDGDGVTTIEEFKSYVKQRAAGISDEQLNTIAKKVDKDSDGVISTAEFDQRMSAFREVMNSVRQQTGAKSTPPSVPATADDSAAHAPVAIAPLTASDHATVLLITADELAEAWTPFATWKTRQGKATKIITVRQIAEAYEADSIQEKIRLCVRDHIDHHRTRWIILGGDCTPTGGLVPGGHTTIHDQEQAGVPTDIVFLSPTNWDADGDGVLGEFADDRAAITYPDGTIGLGRIPMRTARDVAAFTEKIIAYESAYPDTAFANTILYTCTDAPAYPKVRASWDRNLDPAWDGAMMRFFSQETPWDKEGEPGSYQLSAEHVVEFINKSSAGKIHIHGHGLRDRWVLERSMFLAEHVEQLNNTNAYPLITTVSCFTGQYDSAKDPCIVESMIRQPSGGSVAIVAPIRTGKPHFHSPADFRLMVSEGKLDGTTMTMTQYWVNGLSHGATTGEAIMKAKAHLAEDAVQTSTYHLCLCEINLLGDPTLDMRATAPRTPKVSAPKSMSTDHKELTISTDTPGATICLWKGLECYIVSTAAADGAATFSFSALTPGDLLITISGPSLNTITTSITIE